MAFLNCDRAVKGKTPGLLIGLAGMLILLLNTSIGAAQDSLAVADTAWLKGGNFNINISQVELANWAGGGEDALSLGFLFGYFTRYERGNTLWKNNLNLAYGLQKISGQGTRKTDDKIQVITEISRKLKRSQWLWTFRSNFWSQIAKGYIYNSDPDVADQEISRFMAPGYLQLATGYSLTDPKTFTVSAFPVTGKFTFVSRSSLAARYGLDEGENVRGEFGASINANLTHEVMENVKLTTNLNLFSNYSTLSRIDVNWDVVILMKVNKFLTASVATQMIYDHDIDVENDLEDIQRRVQFKELINVGFAYEFGDKKKK